MLIVNFDGNRREKKVSGRKGHWYFWPNQVLFDVDDVVWICLEDYCGTV